MVGNIHKQCLDVFSSLISTCFNLFWNKRNAIWCATRCV